MEPRSPEGVLLTENQYKRFVKVRADHNLDGKTLPLKFRTEDGPEIRIDRITDVRRAAATKAGGQGIRYTCIVCGHEIYLYHDRDKLEFGGSKNDYDFHSERVADYI